MIIEYTQEQTTARGEPTGRMYRHRVHGVSYVQREAYAPRPGDALLVCYNAQGKALAGPLESEVRDWRETDA